MWVNMQKQCKLGLFQDSDFAEDLEDSVSKSGGIFTHFRKSNFCSNQLDVQTANGSVTRFNRGVVLLKAGPRVDGTSALDLWGLVIEVLHSSRSPSFLSADNPKRCVYSVRNIPKSEKVEPSTLEESCLKEIDNVHPNAQFSHHSALLKVFDDTEAVMKMIIKGRSATKRRVSRTHRVALDWLFHRIPWRTK